MRRPLDWTLEHEVSVEQETVDHREPAGKYEGQYHQRRIKVKHLDRSEKN